MVAHKVQGIAARSLPSFKNERVFPGVDDPKMREAFPQAIAGVRARLGKVYPLYIDGQDVTTEQTLDSTNPADPAEVIGRVCQAGVQEAEAALAAAEKALVTWREVPPVERALYLVKAAERFRSRIVEYSAWQVLEEGKQWAQAYNDLAEAIDFLEYNAREMIRLGTPQDMGSYGTEKNTYFYQAKGVAVVIAPWNFPLAISAGMASAAIVAGNPVVYKPSSQSSGRRPPTRRGLPRGGLAGRSVQLCPRPRLGHWRLPRRQSQGQRDRVYRLDGRGPAHRRTSRTHGRGPDARQARRLRDGRQERHPSR